MSSPQSSAYPPAINDAEREQLVQVIKDWSIANGLAVRPPPAAVAATETHLAGTLGMPVPVTVFPSAFPASCFQEAQAAQKAYNELYSAISQDEEFLTYIMKELAGGDEFTTNLWNIHLRVKKEGYVHKHSLGIFRSDYLVHRGESDGGSQQLQIKQVEFNTISASFGGLSSQTGKLHRFLAQTQYPLLKSAAAKYDLPDNSSGQDIAAGIRAAYDVYVQSEPDTLGHKRCVLFVTQEGERNVFDQRHVEYALVDGGGGNGAPPVFRLPFDQVLQRTSVADTPRRQLLYRLPSDPAQVFEVAVAYLRCGYDPSDYPDASAWEARYQMERSAAIKCPTVLTQVAGTKKVQQVLATPRTSAHEQHENNPYAAGLDRFVDPDSEAARQIRRTFTNIYPLDTSAAGRQARAWAQDAAASRKFVLKPQREGGGHNYYKDKIPAHLQTVPEEQWASYILMELITPPPVANLILRNGQVEQGGVICELGIYGTCVWDSSSSKGGGAAAVVVHNAAAGYLLRTKGDQSEEGGVAAGFGCMDSVNLV